MKNYYNIDTNAHYFVPMRPMSRIPGFLSFISSSDPEYFVECEVKPYDIEGIDYKCYLVPVNEECKYNFGKREFYSCEPIFGQAVIRQQGQCIVGGASR